MSYRSIGQSVNIPLFKYCGNVDFVKDVIQNGRIHLEESAVYNDI